MACWGSVTHEMYEKRLNFGEVPVPAFDPSVRRCRSVATVLPDSRGVLRDRVRTQ